MEEKPKLRHVHSHHRPPLGHRRQGPQYSGTHTLCQFRRRVVRRRRCRKSRRLRIRIPPKKGGRRHALVGHAAEIPFRNKNPHFVLRRQPRPLPWQILQRISRVEIFPALQRRRAFARRRLRVPQPFKKEMPGFLPKFKRRRILRFFRQAA